MSPDVLRWIIGLTVLAHGIGHVLFMPLLSEAMRLQSSGHSWLLSAIAGDGPTRVIASTVGAAVVAAFVITAGGILLQTGWWRMVAVGAAVASAVLIVVMWDGLVTAPATAALAFDVALLVALVVLHWPTADVIGG